MEENSQRITELLQHWASGDKDALSQLAPMVYQQLRRMAHQQLRSERRGHTLQSTALVNEAFGRLLAAQPAKLKNREHFLAIAAHVMRQILTEYAHDRQALKRDGGCRIALEEIEDMPVVDDTNLIAIDDVLEELSRIDPRQGQIVEMKFFGGLTAPEIANVLRISVATVERDWSTARIWLRRQMRRVAAP